MNDPGPSVRTSRDGHVAELTFSAPPLNHFDTDLIDALATEAERLDADPMVRSIVLRSDGRHFCAGARLSPGELPGVTGGRHVYDQAARLFAIATPIVVSVQGAAVGGGLGLAMVGDLRVGSVDSRLHANFVALGLHPGFGLTATLPKVVGAQHAHRLLLGGERVDGAEAHRIGLLDHLVPDDQLRERSMEVARSVAAGAPLAVRSIRALTRSGVLEEVRAAMREERSIQDRLAETADYAEGLRAAQERRTPDFHGR